VRAGSAVVFAAAFVAACAAALPEGGARVAPAAAPSAPDAGVVDGGADAGAEPTCPHGRLEDPHRGFVRCLEPGEADAGGLPPPSEPEPRATVDGGPSDAGPADGGASDAAPAGPPPEVAVGEPAFEGGDVPKLDKALAKARAEVGRCVAEHGGLAGAAGSVKLQFLVRARGRAEGVEILKAKGITPEARECIRLALKNRRVGEPSADPVGVTVTLTLAAPR
jgi:hypothetical protein